MPDGGLQWLGAQFAGNLTAAYLAFFVAFAAMEALFGRPRGPDSFANGRMIVNFGLPVASGLLAWGIPFGMVSAAALAERQHWGLFHQIAVPPSVVLTVAILSRTGLGYLVHRLSHELPWLWRLHKVHHSDPHVDVSLSLRHHPLELLPGLLAFSLSILLLGLPIWSVALVEAALIASGYSDHLDVQLPPRAARLLRLVFVTPEVHRIHHSARQEQTDSNYGSLLILWDRLFGSYRAPETESVRRYGLDEVDPGRANSLWGQLLLPFATPAPLHSPTPELRDEL